MWLTRLAVDRPITVTMGLISLVVLGVVSTGRLPLSFLPQADLPFIGVQVPYENGIPSQVEREIARPIEEVLATLGGVQEITSQSDGYGTFVGVQFEWGREIDVLRLEVKEKIDQIRPELPDDVRDIHLMTWNTADIPVVQGRISARDRDLSESYHLIEQRVISRLQRVPGVGRVTVNGVEPPDVTVYLDLERMKEHRVDGREVFSLLRDADVDLTVGHVERDGLRYAVRAGARIERWEDLRELPLNERGLVLGDVAEVHYGTPVLPYGRYINLEPAVAFDVQKSSGANTVDVVEGVREELERINRDPTLEGIDVVMFFDQAAQITHGLEGLLTSGLVGAVLAVAVLYFFLRNLATTLITAMAIPISIVGTCTYLFFAGHSLNVLSMMGLMLGVGMLIDNAVVVLESIVRHMQMGADPRTATLRGTREVGRAVVSATLTSIVVFAPIVLGGGSELVTWLKEVGITISVTLVISLVVSLTVIPVLTAHLLGGRGAVRENPWVEAWAARYERVLHWTALRRPIVTAWVLVPLVVGATVGLIVLTGFGPATSGEAEGIRREYMTVRYEFADDVDYRTAREYAKVVQEDLWTKREDYELRHLYTWYQDGVAMHRLYFEQDTVSPEKLRSMREALRDDLPRLAGVEFLLGDEDGGGSGAQVFEVTLHGENTEELGRLSREVRRRLELLDGIEQVTTDDDRGNRELRVQVDGDRARRLGMDPRAVAEVMGITVRGVPLPELRTARRELDLWVMLDEDDRRTVEDLRSLTVGVENGQAITLDQLATTVEGRGPSRITRVDQRAAVSVRGTYEGEDFDAALDDVRATMAGMALPAGYGWNFGSQMRRQQQQENELGLNALLALVCVYMIMAALFESLRHPLVVMSCVPFAGLGVVWFMMATGTPFNFMAMIGIVILIGIVVNNGIVLIDHVNHHRREGLDLETAVLRGGRERFRPILMTATTTVLGLIPLAVGDGHVGNGELYPMARALMGGLISSTALTLLLLPTYFVLGERTRAFVQRHARSWARWPKRGLGVLRQPAALIARAR
jgi:HAE1 family hydrophobic/amphiphilic exporter-1